MPQFSKRSQERLKTCHPDLQKVLEHAIKNGPDFTVLCGHRSEAEQNKALKAGASKVTYPNSRHNLLPSLAVDIAPYPIDWNDLNRFRFLAGYILGTADSLGVNLRWGGDWDRDYEEGDERFRDLPHFELL